MAGGSPSNLLQAWYPVDGANASRPNMSDRREDFVSEGHEVRITYIHNNAIPSAAANTVHVMKMCAAFEECGISVRLITPEHVPSSVASGPALFDQYGCTRSFSLTRIPCSDPLRMTSFGIRAGVLARKHSPSLVYGRDARGCAVAAALGSDVVFEAHGPLDSFSRSGRLAVRFLTRSPRLKRLVVISSSLADYYLRIFPRLRGRLLVAHDGADPVSYATPPALPSSGRVNVGYVGSLYPGRGIELLAEIAAQMPEVDLHVVGGSAELVAHWRNSTSNLANLVFHGHVDHRDTTGLIASMDIVVAPYQRRVTTADPNFDSARWMSPLKIFEYMSHGKPIICSDLPVLHEILSHGENALLANPDNVDDWVAQLKYLVSQREVGVQLGKAARSLFEENYTWKSRAQTVVAGIAGLRD